MKSNSKPNRAKSKSTSRPSREQPGASTEPSSSSNPSPFKWPDLSKDWSKPSDGNGSAHGSADPFSGSSEPSIADIQSLMQRIFDLAASQLAARNAVHESLIEGLRYFVASHERSSTRDESTVHGLEYEVTGAHLRKMHLDVCGKLRTAFGRGLRCDPNCPGDSECKNHPVMRSQIERLIRQHSIAMALVDVNKTYRLSFSELDHFANTDAPWQWAD